MYMYFSRDSLQGRDSGIILYGTEKISYLNFSSCFFFLEEGDGTPQEKGGVAIIFLISSFFK